MSIGAFFGFLMVNLTMVLGLSYLMMHRMEKRLKAVKAEIQEMEDLVVALVDELEATAQSPPTLPQPEYPQVESTFKPAELPVSNFPKAELLPESSFESVPIASTFSKKPIHDPKHQKVLDLWRQGQEIPEIARSLAMGPGEIRLVIGLYKQN